MKTKLLTKKQQDRMESLISLNEYEPLYREFGVGMLTRKEFERDLLYSSKAEYSDADTKKAKYKHIKSGYAFTSKKDAFNFWRVKRNDFCNKLKKLVEKNKNK
jgi:hypothetical protein